MQPSIHNPHWLIATDDDLHTSAEEAFVIDDVFKLFMRHTPIDQNQPLIVGIDNKNGPITLWDNLHVNLNTLGPRRYDQTVFQLAHELVHVVTHVAPNTNTWFNEVLCEVGAELFLDKMATEWANSVVPAKQHYAVNFTRYRAHMEQTIVKTDLAMLRQSNSDLCRYLCGHVNDYDLNRPIAMRIATVARTESQFWAILPYTFQLEHTKTLTECLDELLRRLPPKLSHIVAKIDAEF